jgi:hypothetical protein
MKNGKLKDRIHSSFEMGQWVKRNEKKISHCQSPQAAGMTFLYRLGLVKKKVLLLAVKKRKTKTASHRVSKTYKTG